MIIAVLFHFDINFNTKTRIHHQNPNPTFLIQP